MHQRLQPLAASLLLSIFTKPLANPRRAQRGRVVAVTQGREDVLFADHCGAEGFWRTPRSISEPLACCMAEAGGGARVHAPRSHETDGAPAATSGQQLEGRRGGLDRSWSDRQVRRCCRVTRPVSFALTCCSLSQVIIRVYSEERLCTPR